MSISSKTSSRRPSKIGANLGLSKVAVIIPAFRAADQIVGVIQAIPKEIRNIIVVDDACPDGTGAKAQQKFGKRISVVFHPENQGVGGAMVTGYRHALEKTKAEYFVKIDADGQMNPLDIPELISPLELSQADYTKGNRFDSIEDLEQMPRLRILGNAILSFFSKVSSGYWNVTDPTNGFTAIRRSTLAKIKLGKIRKSFFFENDMLFRLALVKAVVQDVPLPARFGNESSNLKIRKVLVEFPRRYSANFLKRIIYQYYLREWSPASFELPLGLIFLFSGLVAGISFWIRNAQTASFASAGEVMIASLPVIVGTQLLLAFVNYDISNTPKRPGH